jgi:L-iditol 2-dehydrogenase
MGNPVQTLPVSAAAQREVDLVGVFRYKHTYPQAIELMRLRKEAAAVSHLPDVTKLITHRFRGLEEVPRAFDMAARAKDEEGRLVLKVMVEM